LILCHSKQERGENKPKQEAPNAQNILEITEGQDELIHPLKDSQGCLRASLLYLPNRKSTELDVTLSTILRFQKANYVKDATLPLLLKGITQIIPSLLKSNICAHVAINIKVR